MKQKINLHLNANTLWIEQHHRQSVIFNIILFLFLFLLLFYYYHTFVTYLFTNHFEFFFLFCLTEKRYKINKNQV